MPTPDYKMVSQSDIAGLKEEILESGLSTSELVTVAWASASSFRASDMRGGANGARIALSPQNAWKVNNSAELTRVLEKLKSIQKGFNGSFLNDSFLGRKVSLADLIVLAGAAAIEKAAKDAGISIKVPFTPGRGDATQAQIDVNSFAMLEPKADAFLNYFNKDESHLSPTEMLIDKADQLALTVPEMTVLLGGMRMLGANVDGSSHGVFTDNPGALSNDFFVNILDVTTKWRKANTDGLYEGVDRKTGEMKYTATPVDLIFGSSSELRAIAEVYAFDTSKERFVKDFVKAWVKVMQLDRFDLKHDI